MPNDWEVQSESDYSPEDWAVDSTPTVSSKDVESKIRSTAQAHGVDLDHMVRIARQESGFDPNVVSKKGALGVMQLMPSTAKDLGVDPFDLDQNITGGVRYYKKLLGQFGGDASKASAAYNAGPALVASNRPWPKETRDYVQSVVPNARLPKAPKNTDPWAVADEKAIGEWSVVSQKDVSPFTEPVEGAPSRKQLEAMAGNLEQRAQDIDLQRAAFKLTRNPSGPMVENFTKSVRDYQQDYDAYQKHTGAFNEVQKAWAGQKRPAGAEQTGLPGVMNKLPEPPTPVELAPELDPDFHNSPFANKPGYGIMAFPVAGIYGAARGVERAAQGKPREAAGGAHEVISGAFQAATPFMIASGLSAPIKTAATVGAAMVAQGGVHAGLEALGLPEEYAAVAGDLAGIIAAATAVPAAERAILRQRVKRALQDRLDAEFAARQAGERWARQANQEASVPRIEGTVERPPEPFKEDIIDAEWEAPGIKGLGAGRSSPHPTLKEGHLYQTPDGQYRVTYVGENEVSFEFTNKQGIRRTSSVPIEEFEQTAKRGFRVNPKPAEPPPAPEAAAPQPEPAGPKPQPGGSAAEVPPQAEAAVPRSAPAEPIAPKTAYDIAPEQSSEQSPRPAAAQTEKPRGSNKPAGVVASFEPGQAWEHPTAGQYRVEAVSPDGRVQYTFTNKTGGVTRSSMPVSSFERITKKAQLREQAEPEVAAAPGAPPAPVQNPAAPPVSEAPQRAESTPVEADTDRPDGGTISPVSATQLAIPEATPAIQERPPAVSAPAPASSLPEQPQPKFSRTQANLPKPLAAIVRGKASSIPDEALAEKGREDEPHVTVLYGLHGETPSEVQKLLADEPPIQATIGKTSLFHTDDADVLKLDVDSPDLHRLNGKLAQLEHTSTHPEYKPHITIAYLKKGEGGKYAGQAVPGLTGKTITLNSVAFSDKAHQQTEIPLEGRPEAETGPPTVEPQRPSASPAPGDEPTEGATPNAPVEQIEESPASKQIALSGNTFPYKNVIRRQLGGKWDGEKKVWVIDDTPQNRTIVQGLSKKIVISPYGEPVEGPRATAPVAPSLEVEPTPVVAEAPAQPTNRQKNAAANLRRIADGMQSAIDGKRNPAIAQQNPTARRANIAAGMANEADRMELIQQTLRNLATAHEDGTVPDIVKGIASRVALEELMTTRDQFPNPFIHRAWIEDFNKLKGKPGTKAGLDLLNRRNSGADGGVRLYGDDEIEAVSKLVEVAEKNGQSSAKYAKESLARAKRLHKAGIDPSNWNQARSALKPYESRKPAAPPKEKQIADLERGLIGRKIEGFFPTPKALAERMVEEADIQPGMSVLEPSAGNGRLADEIAKKTDQLTAIEPVQDLRHILELKGHAVSENRDFLEHQGEYDRIVMNPPFEKGQDVDHVRHALELLKPGGKLVAIMGEHAFFANDKKSVGFREWLDQNSGTSEQLPSGTFKESGTGVASRLVTVEKPANAAPSALAPAKEPWQMTREQFRSAVENGQVDFPGWGTGKRSGADYARELRNAKASGMNLDVVQQSFDRAANERHEGFVVTALAEGKTVPPEVLSEYPNIRNAEPKPAAPASRDAGPGLESPQEPVPAAQPEKLRSTAPLEKVTPSTEHAFTAAYEHELQGFRSGPEKQYPSGRLMRDWRELEAKGTVQVQRAENPNHVATIKTQERTEGKGAKRTTVKSYVVTLPNRDVYTYDWENPATNDWAAAKALAQARGYYAGNNAIHAALLHGGEYVTWHERLYAVQAALKKTFPKLQIPEISTAVRIPPQVTLPAAIEMVADSLPRNLGNTPGAVPGSYVTFDRHAPEIEKALAPYQQRVDQTIPIVGADHPRVLELQKLIDDRRSDLNQQRAIFERKQAEKRAEDLERAEGKARQDAAYYARFGAAGDLPGISEYAKLAGWTETGDALYDRALREFGIEKKQLAPLDVSGLKLKKSDLDLLREMKLSEGGTFVPRLTNAQEAEWKQRGWIEENGVRLTETGERAALGVRAADENERKGLPVSAYKPGSGRISDPGDSRYAITSPIPYQGTSKALQETVWHTNGHFLALGNPPKYWTAPSVAPAHLPDISRVIPREPGKSVQPIGFALRSAKGSTSEGRNIYFSNGSAMDAAYFDYVNKSHAPDKWTQEDPEKAFQAWKGKQLVAVVMPMRVDRLPAGIEPLVERKPPGKGQKPAPEQQLAARRESTPKLTIPKDPVQIKITPGKRGSPIILHANDAATQVLNYLSGKQGGPTDYHGLNLLPEGARDYRTLARKELKNGKLSDAQKQNLRRFLNAIEMSVHSPRETVWVHDDEHREATLRHELMHSAQRRLGGKYLQNHVNPERFFGVIHRGERLPLPIQIARAAGGMLAAEGYGHLDDNVLAAEIGAHLDEGTTGWEKMGLSPAEAEILRRHYVKELELQHGRNTLYRSMRLSRILEPFNATEKTGSDTGAVRERHRTADADEGLRSRRGPTGGPGTIGRNSNSEGQVPARGSEETHGSGDVQSGGRTGGQAGELGAIRRVDVRAEASTPGEAEVSSPDGRAPLESQTSLWPEHEEVAPAPSNPALSRLEAEPHFAEGIPVNLVPLRAEAPDKAAFDKAILKAADEGKIVLTRPDHVYDDPQDRPGSRNTLVHDPKTGEYYVAAQAREPEVEAAVLRRPQLTLADPTSREKFLRSADAEYQSVIEGQPGHVYFNEPAHRIILEAFRAIRRPQNDFDGLAVDPVTSRELKGALMRWEATEPELALRSAVAKVRSEVGKALKENPVLTFVNGELPAARLRETRIEEEFHRQQILKTPGDIHLDFDTALFNPLIEAAYEKIRGESPYVSARDAFMEIGARLARRGWGEFGFTPEEGVEAFKAYYDNLIGTHGEQARTIVDFAHPEIRKALGELKHGFPIRQRWTRLRALQAETGSAGNSGGESTEDKGPEAVLSRLGNGTAEVLNHARAGTTNGDPVRAPAALGVPGPPGMADGGRAPKTRQAERGELLPTGVGGRQGDRGVASEVSRTVPGERTILTRPRQPGGSAPHVGNIREWIEKRFGDRDAGHANYSGLGALSDKFLRNLTQLEKRSTKAHAAAIRAASSRAQSATILRAAVIPIQKALKGSEFTWPELRLAMIESRLRGLKERWQDFSDQVRQMTDVELAQAFDDYLVGLLDAIEGKRGLPQDLADTATSLAASGASQSDPGKRAADYDALRQFLAQTFEDASGSVATAMEPAWYDAVVSDRQVQAALGIYQATVESAMEENHALNEGVFSDALGPLDTYYPLISLERNPAKGGAGRRVPYHKPRNIANAFATGLSEGYDATMEALRERLAAAVRSNDKAALIQALEDEGLLHSANREDNLFIDPRTGEGYQGERVEIQAGRQIIQNGKSTFIPPRVALAPKWLARELRPILERNQINTPTVVDKLIRAANWFSLAGPADFVFHSSNVLGALVANTPFLTDTLAGKALSVPFVKKFAALGYMLATDPTTEEAAVELIEMAKLGIIPDRYGSETFSKQAAEDLGAERKRFSFSPALYGPKGLDIRARLLMYRLAKAVNPEASPQELYHFVNQLGNYVPALQSEVERGLKSKGIAPFFTAGSTMLRNGINSWSGRGPIPKNAWQMRLWQQLTGGALGALALWALTYHTLTGKWPWEDKRSKLFQIPVGGGHGPIDSYRHSKLGNALWGSGPEIGYINFGFFNPLVVRGSRAMGLPGAYETRVLGGTSGQSLEAAQRDILNAFMHPASGPVVKAAFVGVTGNELYLTNLRDRSGQIGPKFYPAIPAKTKPGLPALGARSFAALRELNSFYGNLGEASGFLGEDKGKKGNQWLRMGIDLVVPGLVANASNPYKRAASIEQQKRAINRMR